MLHGDAKYIDVLERSLYNAVLSGISLDGKEFFYPNVLFVMKMGRNAASGSIVPAVLPICPVSYLLFPATFMLLRMQEYTSICMELIRLASLWGMESASI